jgi:hypothetical protein
MAICSHHNVQKNDQLLVQSNCAKSFLSRRNIRGEGLLSELINVAYYFATSVTPLLIARSVSI